MTVTEYMIYGFDFIKEDNGGFSVIANDDLGGATCGETYDKAFYMAQWYIRDTAEDLFRDFQFIPKALPVKANQVAVNIGIDSALKIMLLNCLVELRIKKSKLATLMGISPAALNQCLRFDKTTKFETLAKAFDVIGKPLKISC